MITLLHGDNHVQSRTALTTALHRAKETGQLIVHLEFKNLELRQLQSTLESQSLFGDPQLFVGEELHSLPKSKRKDELCTYLGQLSQTAAPVVLLWEKKLLTATELKRFAGAKVTAFAATRVMFSWLQALTGQASPSAKQRMLTLFRAAVESDGEQFCSAMLARQVRLLLQAKEGSLPPTQAKVLSQARLFSVSQLHWLHQQLTLIDQRQKSAHSLLSLASELEFLQMSL